MKTNGKVHRTVAQISKGQALFQKAFAAGLALQRAIADLEKAAGARGMAEIQAAAWAQIHYTLWSSVASMNRHATKHQRLFEFASRACYWPVVQSPGLGFLDAEQADILKILRVGSAVPISVVNTKWHPHDGIGKLAMDLWHRVYNRRLFEHPLDADDPVADHQAAKRFRKQAAALPPFSEKSLEQWWTLAKGVLERRWNDPGQQEDLTKLVTAESKRKSPGRAKEHLFRTVRERFESMAGMKHRKHRG